MPETLLQSVPGQQVPPMLPKMLTIFLNGAPLETTAATVEDLIAEQGHGTAKIATAVNGDFVPARKRSGLRLNAGDRVEIVSARQGG